MFVTGLCEHVRKSCKWLWDVRLVCQWSLWPTCVFCDVFHFAQNLIRNKLSFAQTWETWYDETSIACVGLKIEWKLKYNMHLTNCWAYDVVTIILVKQNNETWGRVPSYLLLNSHMLRKEMQAKECCKYLYLYTLQTALDTNQVWNLFFTYMNYQYRHDYTGTLLPATI